MIQRRRADPAEQVSRLPLGEPLQDVPPSAMAAQLRAEKLEGAALRLRAERLCQEVVSRPQVLYGRLPPPALHRTMKRLEGHARCQQRSNSYHLPWRVRASLLPSSPQRRRLPTAPPIDSKEQVGCGLVPRSSV